MVTEQFDLKVFGQFGLGELLQKRLFRTHAVNQHIEAKTLTNEISLKKKNGFVSYQNQREPH